MTCSPGVVEVPGRHLTAGTRPLGIEQRLASASTAASAVGPLVPLAGCSLVQVFALAAMDIPGLALDDGLTVIAGLPLTGRLASVDGLVVTAGFTLVAALTLV